MGKFQNCTTSTVIILSSFANIPCDRLTNVTYWNLKFQFFLTNIETFVNI